MKRLSLLALVVIAVAALLSASPVQSSRKDGAQGGWHIYTFDQAVKAGVEPSLQEELKESGLPLCPPPNEGTGGYKDPAALNAAIAAAPEAPTCMADPRGTIITVCTEGCPGAFGPPGVAGSRPSRAALRVQ